MKKVTMKQRWIAVVLTLVMSFTLLTPYKASAAETATYAGYVYFSVEKNTISQGFVMEPMRVGVEQGETLAALAQRVLGDKSTYTGDLASYYLTGVKDGGEPAGWDKSKIPAKTIEAAGGIDNMGARAENGVLSAGDYHEQSGWMFVLNNAGTMAGANDYVFGSGAYTFKDGDVIRLVFSAYGWGADTVAAWDTPLYTCGNMDPLIKSLADYSSLSGTDEYKKAHSVAEKLEATDEEIKAAAASLKIADSKKKVFDYLTKTVTDPTVGSTGGEWAVFALARGDAGSEDFYNRYYANVIYHVEKVGNAVLDNKKSTENSRLVIALAAIGANPKNVSGFDLTEPLKDTDYVTRQGITGAIYALIALDTGDYGLDETKTTLRNFIVSKALANGGWNLSGDKADPDITAMAITALAPYYESDANVKAAVDKVFALDLKLENAEAYAQAVVALSALKSADAYDNVDSLIAYQDKATGGFAHEAGKAVDSFATEQGAYALVAAERLAAGKASLYDIKKDAVKPKYNIDRVNELLYVKSNADKTDKPKEKVKSFTVKNIKYKVLTSKTVAVTGLKKTKKQSVNIKAKVSYKGKTYKITQIAAKAFAGNKNLTKVTLGKYVTVVGKAAFKNCKKLKKLVINAKKLKKIGKQAFKGTKVKI